MADQRYNLTLKTKVGSSSNQRTISFYADDGSSDAKAKAVHTGILVITPAWVMPMLSKVVVEPVKGAIPSTGQYDAKPMYCTFADADSNLWKFRVPRVAKGTTSTEKETFQTIFVTQGIKFLLKGGDPASELKTITSYVGAGFGSIVDEFVSDTAATENTPV